VTATVADGAVAALNTALANASGSDALSLTVTDTTGVSASALTELNDKTSVAVNATSVTSVTGSYAELSALYAAGAAGQITGLGNEGVTVSSSNTVTVDQANDLASKTTGGVTATISNTALSAYAALTETGNTYTISIADTAIDAAALRALDAKTAGTITLTGATSVSGVYADVNAVLTSTGIGRSATTAIDVTVTDTITAGDANTLVALPRIGAGVVTATIQPGSATDINTALLTANASANDKLTITLTDTSLDAAGITALNALNGKTSVAVNAGSVLSVTIASGDGFDARLSALGDAYGAGITGLGNETITVQHPGTTTITATQANTLAGLTTGVVTATVEAGTASALNSALVNAKGGDALTLKVTDTTDVSASALIALAAKTTDVVDASSVTALSGSLTQLSALYAAGAAGKITGLGNEAVTIIDPAGVSAAQANQIALLTSGTVTVSLSASAAELNNALTDATVGTYTLTVTGTSAALSDLNALRSKTTGTIEVTSLRR
jgi:hypothetical protein